MNKSRLIIIPLVSMFLVQPLMELPAQSVGLPTVAPGSPFAAVVTDSKSDSLTIEWQPPFANTSAAIDYQVRYSQNNGVNWQIYDDGVSTATAMDLYGLDPNTDYIMSIRSIGTLGNSGWVDVISIGSYRPMKVALSESHTCILYSDGTIGCRGIFPTPDEISTSFRAVDGITNAIDLAVSSNATCALIKSGEIYCFGDNQFGQLGNGNSGENSHSEFPTLVNGIADAVSIEMNLSHTCAVLINKTIKCWGSNESGQLGDNTLVSRSTPVLVSNISTATKVSSGASHTCALLEDGKIKCWGDNSVGQLGNASTVASKLPVNVSGIANAIDLDVGGYHSCALLATHEVKCWGLNISSQLGIVSWPSEYLETPVLVQGISNAISLGIGHKHSCAVLETQRIKCWGKGNSGALGNGAYQNQWDPVELDDSGDVWSQVVGGVESTCGLNIHYEPYCWGSNFPLQLQIGDGSVQNWDIPRPTGFNFGLEKFRLANLVPAPSEIELLERTKTSISLTWESPDPSSDFEATYKVEWSNDNDSWLSANTTNQSFKIENLNKATMYLVRISTVTSDGVSTPSNIKNFFTSGTREMRFEFLDSNGDPIVGGSVGWALDDGTFRSSKKYGITDNGVLDFPLVAAGSGKLTVNGIMTSQGGTVSGEWNYDFGSIPEPFVIPSEFSNSSWDIEVLLPNGLPLVGADVEVFGLDSEGQDAEREFTIDLKSSGKTDERGIFTAKGFGLSNISARVTYDDGVLVQSKTADLVSAHTTLMVDEMPWLVLDDDSTTANFGTLVPVPISVQEDVAPLFAKVNRAIGLSNSGISVQIIPPKGAKQNCKGKVLKSKTNGSGEALLKVCATKSGTYLIKGSGAAPTEGLFLKVKGASPMPVTSASAKSPEFGRMNISWNPPLYNGGSKIIKYKVKIVGGGKVYSKETKSKSIVFSGLKNATRYKATITAVSANGESDPVVITAGVA